MRKRIPSTTALLLVTLGLLCHASWGLSAPTNTNAALEIHLSRPHVGGAIQVLLFDSAEGFEDFDQPVQSERFPAEGQQTLQIKQVPPGNYALLVYHDENDNQQLDVNFIGIPREPVGFSNAYRPRGAPTFSKARFAITPGKNPAVQMDLVRPLGKRGRIGAGAVVITRSSPYAQSTDNPLNVLPALVYVGNRIQITGPYAQIGIRGSGRTRLAATLAYRQATYKANDSPILAGMRDRRATAMAGLRLQMDTVYGINFAASYQRDALNRIGGGEGSMSLARPIPWNRYRFIPSLGLQYMRPKLAANDYGVSAAEATDARPQYRPGNAFNPEAGFSIFAEITPNIMGAMITSIEWLDNRIRKSPIVDDNRVLKATAFVVYMF